MGFFASQILIKEGVILQYMKSRSGDSCQQYRHIFIKDLNVRLRVMDGTFWKDKLHAVFNRSESKLALFENILSQDQRYPGQSATFSQKAILSLILRKLVS